jgi:hypothetical protein
LSITWPQRRACAASWPPVLPGIVRSAGSPPAHRPPGLAQ